MTEYKKHLRTIGLAPTTIKSYVWHLSKFLDWLGEKKMTEQNFKKYFNYLVKNSQRVNTVNLRLKIINNYLKFLGKRWRFDLLSDEDVPIEILTDEQLEEFLDNAKKKQNTDWPARQSNPRTTLRYWPQGRTDHQTAT